MKSLLFASVTLIIFFSSCNRYYMPVNSSLSIPEAISKAKAENRYFILRDSMFKYAMNNVELTESRESISCVLESLPSEHKTYVNAKGRNFYYNKSKGQDIVLKEVHLFSDHLIATGGNTQAIIPVSAITGVQEINYDKRRTKRQHRTAWLATAGGVVAAIALASMAVASSLASSF
jgi:hypothetical protein